jgi:hypothetical protein
MMLAKTTETYWWLIICHETYFMHVHIFVFWRKFKFSFNARLWNVLILCCCVGVHESYNEFYYADVIVKLEVTVRVQYSTGVMGGSIINILEDAKIVSFRFPLPAVSFHCHRHWALTEQTPSRSYSDSLQNTARPSLLSSQQGKPWHLKKPLRS